MGQPSGRELVEHITFAILRQGESIVMVQQGSPHGDKTFWGLPGGLVEAGELVVDALVREVREEAGVQITGIKHLACCSQV